MNAFSIPPAPGPNKDYSDNELFQIGETVQLTWEMYFTHASLSLVQDNHLGDLTGGDHAVILPDTILEAYTWNVSYESLDPTVNNVYYLEIGGDDYSFTSHYFNISGVETTTASSTSTTPTTNSSPTSSFSTSTTAAATTTVTATIAPTPTQQPSMKNGLGSGSVAGLSVGVSLGTILMTVAIWQAWRWFKKGNGQNGGNVDVSAGAGATGLNEEAWKWKQQAQHTQLVEADDNFMPELHGMSAEANTR